MTGPAAGGFGGPVAGPVAGAGPIGQSPSVQNDDAQEGDYSAIPGTPDVDYPIYSEIPETSFDCNQQQYPGNVEELSVKLNQIKLYNTTGYYADVEARCQVFHICALNRTFNFLCPNGTIFSQENLVCVWWNQFDCNSAPSLFGNNANLYEDPQSSSQGGQQGAIAPGVGPAAVAPGVIAPGQNDFVGVTGTGIGGGAPYPAAGRPTGPANVPATGFGPTAGGPYPGTAGPTNAYVPPATGTSNFPSGPAAGYPSTQGPYPAPGAPNVPSTSYQPPQTPQAGYTPSQNDAPYPAPGAPPRDYLPPRRG